jgi:hypothetical protein
MSDNNPACTGNEYAGPQPPNLWSRTTSNCNNLVGTGLTYKDLDMRRKAEIFKYKNNNSNMSKKQLFAQKIKGYGPNANRVWANQNVYGSQPNVDNLPQVGNTLLCKGKVVNCSPTSSNGVPGPIMQICYNKDVPLVNYVIQQIYTDNGTKFPQTCWTRGDNGFPVGKAGK